MENASIANLQSTPGTSQADNWMVRFDELCGRLAQPQEDLHEICFQLIQIWLKQGKDLDPLRDRMRQEVSRIPKALVAQIEHVFKSQLVYWLKVDRLQRSIKLCVDELSCKENDPGVYRKLVQLGLEYRPQLHRYRQCLIDQNISIVRASEITGILKDDEAARKFVDGAYSVRQAIAAARASRAGGTQTGTPNGPSPLLKRIRMAMRDLLDQAEGPRPKEPDAQPKGKVETKGKKLPKKRPPW